MKTITCAMLLVVFVSAGVSVAQTNSWISPTRGYWDDYTKWSLGVAPSTNGQSLILITNDLNGTVTIDSITASDYPTTMIVSDLVVSAPGVAVNTLELSEVGTNVALQVLDTLIITNGGILQITDSALSVQGATNSGLNVDGSVLIEGNSLLAIAPALYAGLDSNSVGSIVITGGQLLLTNIAASAIGVNSAGQLFVSSGVVQNQSGFVFVGSGIGSVGALTVAGGSFVSAPYSRLVVGMETGAVGYVSVTGGSLIVSNSFITLVGGDGSGELDLLGGTNTFGPVEVGGDPGSEGTLTISGGTNTLAAGLVVGSALHATGTVWMTGGQVLATNLSTWVGQWGDGAFSMSNGNWVGNTMLVGLNTSPSRSNSNRQVLVPGSYSQGTVNLEGGTMTLYSSLVIGSCPSGGVGVVNVAGGSLYVTNATHNAFINLSDGELNLNGGTLQADILIMTNGCGTFIRGGGTLEIGSLVDGIPSAWKTQYGLNPTDPTVASADPDGDGMSNLQEYLAGTDPTNSTSIFHITSILPSGNDIGITWSVVTDKTYLVQVTTNLLGGAYGNLVSNRVVIPASPVITQTNYVDVGAAAAGGPRFYRIQLVTSP